MSKNIEENTSEFVVVDCSESTFTKASIEMIGGIPHIKVIVNVKKIAEAYPFDLPTTITSRVPLGVGIQLNLIAKKEEKGYDKHLQSPDVIPSPLVVDFTEDFNLENGRNILHCTNCGVPFIGHKRRELCKLCQKKEDEADGDNTLDKGCW